MKVINRKFNREYQEIEKFEVGIALTGAEVKSIRDGRIKLDDAYVKVLDSEAYLINAPISVYEYARPQGYDEKRTRKLLLHKKEILRLKVKMQTAAGLTVAPVSCYNKHGLIKLEIALVKPRREIGKKKYEKQQKIQRIQEREAKEYMKV
jgi:SsrA-binding protein